VDHVREHEQGAAAEVDAILPALLQAADADLPVLPATAVELARLDAVQERVPANALAQAILRDPFLSLRVLRYLAQHRTRSQTADITTASHAVMMLGQARFFRAFQALPRLDERLHGEPLRQVLRFASRARLAALLARDWAVQRHDVEPEEITVAALLHTIPDALALMAAIPLPASIEARTALRGRLFAALAVPGIAARMHEPPPLQDLRCWNAQLACRVAHHTDEGWQLAAIAADLDELQRFLHMPAALAWERVRKPLLAAAREWHYYGVPPAAAAMPFVIDDPQRA
jgi:hypothetical protein